MRQVYNCGNCNYRPTCEKEGVNKDADCRKENWCFEHSHFEEGDP